MLDLKLEALKVRKGIEQIAHDKSHFFSNNFPINACKHASIFLCYHLETCGLDVPIDVVFGVSNKRDRKVGHWWIEVGGYLIDLTADQFNIIEENELSYKIRAGRSFLPVYCCPITKAPHHRIFSCVDQQSFTWNIDEIDEVYIEFLVLDYERLNL
ncbi:hypothetical protein L1D32_11705 [Shewanella insulae]|uniref:hypothetical protein n=1 Tax=Shewanella insulae TaxID=2681496 RepID=UPI001EFD7ABA|nr:hypothetical protein [Shewanella insulae]MCG9738826.1 hypothetical protein [Shewanella insulae]